MTAAHRLSVHRLLTLLWLAAAAVGPSPANGQAEEPQLPAVQSEDVIISSKDNQPAAKPAAVEKAEEAEKPEETSSLLSRLSLFGAPSKEKKIRSLFFAQEEIKAIHLAIGTYTKHALRGDDLTFDEEEFLKRLGGLKKTTQSRYYTFPQFFLSSLVYHSDVDWIVWIGGRKITPRTAEEMSELHVLEISGEEVTFEWMPVAMDKVLQIWNKYPNPDVKVDVLRSKVIFKLRPNQTFSSYVMKVLEGKVMPVTVDNIDALDELPVQEKKDVKKDKNKKAGEKKDGSPLNMLQDAVLKAQAAGKKKADDDSTKDEDDADNAKPEIPDIKLPETPPSGHGFSGVMNRDE